MFYKAVIVLSAATLLRGQTPSTKDFTKDKVLNRRVNLSGTWRIERLATVPEADMLLSHVGDEVSFGPSGMATFHGKFVSATKIVGEGPITVNGTTSPGEMHLIIEDPDRIRLEAPASPGEAMTVIRIDPLPADVACDDKNSNHVKVPWAYRRGVRAFMSDDYPTAACWFSIGAAADEPASQGALAFLLDAGKGVPQDSARAFQLAQKSAAHDIGPAQLLLARMYKRGRGTPVDNEKSQAWSLQAQGTLADSRLTPEQQELRREAIKRLIEVVGEFGILDDLKSLGDLGPSGNCSSQYQRIDALGYRCRQ